MLRCRICCSVRAYKLVSVLKVRMIFIWMKLKCSADRTRTRNQSEIRNKKDTERKEHNDDKEETSVENREVKTEEQRERTRRLHVDFHTFRPPHSSPHTHPPPPPTSTHQHPQSISRIRHAFKPRDRVAAHGARAHRQHGALRAHAAVAARCASVRGGGVHAHAALWWARVKDETNVTASQQNGRVKIRIETQLFLRNRHQI
jgi:hypothetical protein